MKKLWQHILNVLAFMLDVKKVEVQQEQGEVLIERFNVGCDPGKGDDHESVVQLPSHEEQHKVDELAGTCNHQFGRVKFVKGGGHEQVCKLCGYVKHVDKHWLKALLVSDINITDYYGIYGNKYAINVEVR